MIKKLAILLVSIYSGLSFSAELSACPPAAPTSSPAFCSTFKASAVCYCQASGLPSGMCGDLNLLYSRMMSTFHSLDRACGFQKNTSKQICIDDWNCYRSGGTNSQNELCGGTGAVCV